MQEKVSKYCPNLIYNANNIAIGEYKTIEDAMNSPLKGCWCVNRDEDNLFEKYKSQGYRIFIIFAMNKTDSLRFVLAIVGHRQVKYWDANDIPIEVEKHQYELSIGAEAEEVIYSILRQQSTEPQITTENKTTKDMKENKKQTVKLNESQLRQIIKEALNELDWKTYANAAQKDAERQSDEYNQRKSRGEKLSPEEIVGMFKRPMKFRTAAIDALNKKYKEGNEDGYDFFATQHGSPLNGKAKYYANVENRTGEGYGYASSTEDGKTFKSQPLTRQTRLKNKGREITVSPERIFGYPNYDKVKKLKDFASEVGNYNQGNYDYSTEKGWHLKESQLKNIIRESIKKVLGY